jgi:hypothetical protein
MEGPKYKSPFSPDEISERGENLIDEFNFIFSTMKYPKEHPEEDIKNRTLALYVIRRIAELQLEVELLREQLSKMKENRFK